MTCIQEDEDESDDSMFLDEEYFADAVLATSIRSPDVLFGAFLSMVYVNDERKGFIRPMRPSVAARMILQGGKEFTAKLEEFWSKFPALADEFNHELIIPAAIESSDEFDRTARNLAFEIRRACAKIENQFIDAANAGGEVIRTIRVPLKVSNLLTGLFEDSSSNNKV